MFNKSTLLGMLPPLAAGLLPPLAAGLTLLTLPGCTGKLLGGAEDRGEAVRPDGMPVGAGGPGGTAGSSAGGISELSCSQQVVDPGPSPMRLLSRAQYLATVHDLAGEVPGLDAALGAEVEASAFGLVQPDVTQVQLEHFQKAAEVIANSITSDPASLDEIAPCASGTAPADCARSAIRAFGARAYRAPISDAADVERHLQLFNVGAASGYRYGIEMLLRGMLQSPRFLYRVELGTGERVSELAVKLSPYEVAARLSYTLWGTLPDDELNRAAASGELDTREGVAAQIDWMLQEPRGQKLVNRFLESWTHVSAVDGLVKDPQLFPEFQSESFKRSLKAQASAFFEDLLQNQGGKLSALFTSPAVWYNQDLAGYYGLTGTSAFQSVQRTDGTAAGILTLPAVLAVAAKPKESSPIYRGRFVREALLCQQLPAPPADVPAAPEVMPGVSTRERAAQHEVDPTCSGCHQLLDPIGFGFENFDSLGRYRAEDGGKPVDASGRLVGTRDIDGPFNGVAELGQKLAQSQELRECVARQWFRFAISRFEGPADGCSMKSLLEGFESAGEDLRQLPQAIAKTDAFLYRRPIDAQVKP